MQKPGRAESISFPEVLVGSQAHDTAPRRAKARPSRISRISRCSRWRFPRATGPRRRRHTRRGRRHQTPRPARPSPPMGGTTAKRDAGPGSGRIFGGRGSSDSGVPGDPGGGREDQFLHATVSRAFARRPPEGDRQLPFDHSGDQISRDREADRVRHCVFGQAKLTDPMPSAAALRVAVIWKVDHPNGSDEDS